ncbi:YphA family membrane protein [Brevibacillus borstelensis]|uniref:YphA family membrane protein n=1 Tax=Brevibacillus borstelensis TaxID=45462 RepID=UPI0030C15957
MNDGTLAILTQWCFLCLIWMGVFDGALHRWGIKRAGALAVVTLFLVCTFVNWRLYVFPAISVSISGAILPFLCAGWLYSRQQNGPKRMYVIIGAGVGTVLFWFRWLLFTDPILAIWDVRWMLPVCAVFAALTVSRSGVTQMFLLLLSLSLSDLLYSLYEWKLTGSCLVGNEYAHDLLWSAFSLWGVCAASWALARLLFRFAGRNTSNSDRNR